MSGQHETSGDVLQSVWMVSHDHNDMDEDCSPTKPCRNMKDVTFDGYAEPGSDLGAAWRAKLAREGKLSTSEGSIRDLVLGQGE
jgi:hypothetical protein